jgi:hypothetical protein
VVNLQCIFIEGLIILELIWYNCGSDWGRQELHLICIDVFHKCLECLQVVVFQVKYLVIRVVDPPSYLITFLAVDALVSHTFLKSLAASHEYASVGM